MSTEQLFEHARQGSLIKFGQLAGGGADLSVKDADGMKALMHAAANNQYAVSGLLIGKHPANIAAQDNAGMTALMHACIKGHAEVATLLLDRGADAEQVDKAGFYPFHHAVAHKNKEVVEFLLTRGGFDANIASHKDGVTALHMAAEFNHLDIMQLLLTHSAAVDQPDSNQLTALHRATMADNRVAAQVLLQWGADVLAENSELRTPLKLAQSMAHNRTVEVLQQHAREEAEMMMTVRAELTEKRKQQTMAPAGTTVVA